MEMYILEKKDGIVIKKDYHEEDLPIIKSQNHLCNMACENAYSNKCLKIYEKRKRKIGEYDFITDGIQILTNYDFVDIFIVKKCKKYNKSEATEKIRPDKLATLIKELRMAYYGTNSIEESYDIEKNSVKAKKNESEVEQYCLSRKRL